MVQLLTEAMQRQADDVEEITFDAFDQCATDALNAVCP